MSTFEAPVSRWIAQLRGGEQEAARLLWQHYYPALLAIVSRHLPGSVRRAFDEEDVVLSAFQSFCSGAAGEQFPDLNNRDNLWALLVTIARRKCGAYTRHAKRIKRGGGRVVGESAVAAEDTTRVPHPLNLVADRAPGPEEVAALADSCEHLFQALGDESLQTIAALTLQGWTTDAIAEQLSFTRRTVQRRLQMIRTIWCQRFPEQTLGGSLP